LRRFRRRRRKLYARKKLHGKKYYSKTRMTTATTTTVTSTTTVPSIPTQPLKDPSVWHNMSTGGITTTTIGIGILPAGLQAGLLESGERERSQSAPAGRESHVAVMDYMDRFWIFGGDIFGESGYFNDLFYLDTTQDPLQWVQAFPDGILPEPRDGFTAVTDTQKKKMWIFGGANRTQVMNDVFYIDLTQATLTMGLFVEMWIFGGSHGSFGIMNFSNEVFCLDTNKVPPEWVQVNASGYIPPIQSAAAAMDSRDRLWVMGGTAQPDGSGGITRAFEDVFYLDTQQVCCGSLGAEWWTC